MLTVQTAAVSYEDGMVYDMPRPARHQDVLKLVVEKGNHNPRGGVQGFKLSDGTFADRKQARVVAIAADQLLKNGDGSLSDRVSTSDELYSECIFEGTMYNFNPTIEDLQKEVERQRDIIINLSKRLRQAKESHESLKDYVDIYAPTIKNLLRSHNAQS